MRIIFFLIIAVIASAQACPGNRDDLLQCFDRLIDTNHDGDITSTELAQMFIDHRSCFPTQQPEYFEHYTPAFLMSQCDADGNGVLNVLDWNHENACLKKRRLYNYVCNLCTVCK